MKLLETLKSLLMNVILKKREIKELTKETIGEAQQRVENAMKMFEKVKIEIESANCTITCGIEDINLEIQEYENKIYTATSAKRTAESNILKNSKIVKKLDDFLCVD